MLIKINLQNSPDIVKKKNEKKPNKQNKTKSLHCLKKAQSVADIITVVGV